MSEQTENCTKKPAEEPRRGQLLEELRFAKKQQWAIATAAVTLLGAVYAVANRAGPSEKEKIAIVVIITLIVTLGCSFLLDLQKSMRDSRLELDPGDKDPLLRGVMIVGALIGIVIQRVHRSLSHRTTVMITEARFLAE